MPTRHRTVAHRDWTEDRPDDTVVAMGGYEGRTALIVGGTRGIGLETARLLRDEGARVLVTGSAAESVDAARADLGPGVTALRSDVTDRADRDELAARVTEALGPLDLVFLNVGITASAPVEQVTEELYDRLFAVNTRGPYFLLQELVPLVKDGGAVVVTTSVADVRGLAGSSVYAATKAALRSMVRSYARELLPRRIRVNAVSPGGIDTGIAERSMPPDVAARLIASIVAGNPMSRLGRPEEVAAAVAYLGFAATYTTGVELAVDGGSTQL